MQYHLYSLKKASESARLGSDMGGAAQAAAKDYQTALDAYRKLKEQRQTLSDSEQMFLIRDVFDAMDLDLDAVLSDYNKQFTHIPSQIAKHSKGVSEASDTLLREEHDTFREAQQRAKRYGFTIPEIIEASDDVPITKEQLAELFPQDGGEKAVTLQIKDKVEGI